MHVFPEGFKAFKQVEIWPGMNMAVLSGYKGQVGFAQVAQETLVPEHTHQGQWGVVLEGEVVFAMESETRVFRKGDYYQIPRAFPTARSWPPERPLLTCGKTSAFRPASSNKRGLG